MSKLIKTDEFAKVPIALVFSRLKAVFRLKKFSFILYGNLGATSNAPQKPHPTLPRGKVAVFCLSSPAARLVCRLPGKMNLHDTPFPAGTAFDTVSRPSKPCRRTTFPSSCPYSKTLPRHRLPLLPWMGVACPASSGSHSVSALFCVITFESPYFLAPSPLTMPFPSDSTPLDSFFRHKQKNLSNLSIFRKLNRIYRQRGNDRQNS